MSQVAPRRYLAPALDRGLTILEYLAENSSNPLSLAQMTRDLAMPKSSLFRLLATLETKGYVERDEEGRYRLGTKVLEFEEAYRPWSRLRGVASPFMYQLAEQAKETCHLAVLGEGGAVYIDKVEGPRSLTLSSRIGAKAALHASAVGKVLMAGLREEELEEVMARYGLPKLTERTIISLAELRSHLAKVREQGYAVDDEEEEGGVRCLGAPIRDHRGKAIAALSLAGLSANFAPERIPELVKMLKETTAKISHHLGYVSPGGNPTQTL